MKIENPYDFTQDLAFRAASPLAQVFALYGRAYYARVHELPNDPELFALAIGVSRQKVTKVWDEIRSLFRDGGDILLDPQLEKSIRAHEEKSGRLAAARENRWQQKSHPVLQQITEQKSEQKSVSPYKEHAHDAHRGVCDEKLSNTSKAKDSECAEAPPQMPPVKAKRVARPRVLSQAQALQLSLEEFDWNHDCEAQMQLARAEYPSNQLRIARDGSKSKCLPGTQEQNRNSWKRIMIEYPEVTPRMLKACLFAYLDQIDRDERNNISSWVVNLLTFWKEDAKMWEDWLPKAKENIAKLDAQAMGALPELELTHA